MSRVRSKGCLAPRAALLAPLLLPLATIAASFAFASPAHAGGEGDFSYLPPGDLAPGSGEGRPDVTVYVPGMRYPVESAPSFPNSQVWGRGGSQGGGGGQCDIENFSYPWRDNYCESRQWDMPMCPSGTGHQGQDIRGATCDADTHWIVSASDGTVTSIGSYSLYVTAPDGTRFDYLHSSGLQVSVGDEVTRGQRLSRVSNEFGGTPTTVHLHFNLRQNVDGVGTVYVPPYMSLVEAYQALIGPPPTPVDGALDEVSCDGIRGWSAALDALDAPVEALLYFDGAPGEGQAIGYPVLADQTRDDLCGAIGSCEHGFSTGLPLSLLDATEHAVRAFGTRGLAGDQVELDGSPKTFSCPLEIPAGVRRAIRDREAETAWRFSSFWDVAEVSQGVLDTLPEAEPLGDAPRVVVTEAEPDQLWLIDGEQKRRVSDALVAAAWELDPILAERVTGAELEAIAEGAALPPRPFVLRGPSGASFLIDGPLGEGGGSASAGSGGGAPAGAGGAGAVGPAGSGGGDAAEGSDGGCGCRTAGGDVPSRPVPWAAVALAFLGAVGRRRRRG